MTNLKILAAALALCVVTAAPARADVWNFGGCGGSHFATCMSGNLTWDGGNQLVLTLHNDDTQGVNFKSIGLVNLGGTGLFSSGVLTSGAPTPTIWGLTNDLGGDGVPAEIFQIGPTSAPNTNGLLAQTMGVFTFTFNVPLFTQAEFDNIGVGVHGINGPNGCSTKFAIWNGADGNVTNDFGPEGYSSNCVPTTTIPEPVTVVLLGTGLLAVAGIARRRREDFEA